MTQILYENRWLLVGLSAMLLLPLVMTLMAFGTLAATPTDQLVAGTPLVLTVEREVTPTVIPTPTLDPDALFSMGITAYRTGDLVRAEEQLRATLLLVPGEAAVHNALGLVLAAGGRAREARLAYLRAAELDPALAEARFNLGTLYHDQERWGQAEAAYREALALRAGFVDATIALGTLFLDQERYGDAVAVYETGLKQTPDSVEIHRNLAVARVAGGDVEGAVSALESAVALAPDDPVVRYDLALVYVGQGRAAPARNLLNSIVASEPADSIWAERAAKQLEELAELE
jgi:Flp pilus assembly protein TadD